MCGRFSLRPIPATRLHCPTDVAGYVTNGERPRRRGRRAIRTISARPFRIPAPAARRFCLGWPTEPEGSWCATPPTCWEDCKTSHKSKTSITPSRMWLPNRRRGPATRSGLRWIAKRPTVRSRTSYCTAKPSICWPEPRRARNWRTARQRTQAGGIAASIQLPYFYLSPNVARVNLAMEIAADALKFENQKGKLHAEIDLLGIAPAPDGERGSALQRCCEVRFRESGRDRQSEGKISALRKGVQNRSGQYRFTMAFSSGRSEFRKAGSAAGRANRGSPADLALSSRGPQQGGPSGGRSGPGSRRFAIGDQTPLVAQGMQVIPAGSSQFLKSEPAFFYFEVYDSNPASVTAQVRILDRSTGASKWDSGRGSLAFRNRAEAFRLVRWPLDRINSK